MALAESFEFSFFKYRKKVELYILHIFLMNYKIYQNNKIIFKCNSAIKPKEGSPDLLKYFLKYLRMNMCLFIVNPSEF